MTTSEEMTAAEVAAGGYVLLIAEDRGTFELEGVRVRADGFESAQGIAASWGADHPACSFRVEATYVAPGGKRTRLNRDGLRRPQRVTDILASA